jgi:CheY-like chemotaxis protein
MSGERILIVEDESILAMLIKGKLRSSGYEVADWVDTGENAIKKAKELLPDLILMDIVLKGKMDGIEASKQIRNRLDIPIIYLTAYSDDDVLKRARITEPYGYLIKPFREDELNANIEMAIYKHKSEKKKREIIRKKVLADFYEFIQTSLNKFSDCSEKEIKAELLNFFAHRVEKDLKSNFDMRMEDYVNNTPDDIDAIFDAYLSWLSNLFSSFGIRNKIDYNDLGYYIEFINCPWELEAKKKPIFCLNCQAVVNCSLSWAQFEGNVDKDATIAEGSDSCIFRLY